jgi:hypothetical protein
MKLGKTMVEPFDSEPDVPDSRWVVIIRFTNTCKNKESHCSDARRFVQPALTGIDGELHDFKFNGMSLWYAPLIIFTAWARSPHADTACGVSCLSRSHMLRS